MPRNVAAEIARNLQSRIASGEWADSRIPAERELAADLGIARNTLRRAMALLEKDGAIARQVGRGTFVMNDNHALAGTIARMQGASPADVMEIRFMLEPHAAAFAATNASTSDLALVHEAHQAALGAQDMPSFELWDAEFHQRIVACSRNDLLREFHNLLRALRNQSPWFEMKRRSFSEERRQTYCAEHATMLDALTRRDPEAARDAMQAHLLTVRVNMIGR